MKATTSIIINDTTQVTTAPPNPTATAISYEAEAAEPAVSIRSANSAQPTIKSRILAASAIIAIATTLVKLGGFVKEMVVAWRFGTSDDLDAFGVAVILPFSLVNMIATPFQTSFIPTYIQVQQREGILAAQKLLSSSLVWLLGIFAAVIAILLLSGPIFLPLFASGFTTEKLGMTFHLLCIVTPMILFAGTSFLFAGVLNVKERFTLAASTPLITTALTILLLMVAHWMGVYALAIAITMGAVAELLVLGIALQRQGVSVIPRWHAMSDQLGRILRNSFSLILGNVLMTGTQLISIAIAARMAAGSVASLSYASKVTLLSAGLIASSLGTATISFFAKLSAQENWQELKSTLHHFLGIAFLITCPITILIMIFSTPITRLLFQRGAFSATDVEIVSELVFYLALQIPFYVANVLVAKIFLALQRPQLLLFGSAMNLLVNTIASYILSVKLGLIGVAIATSLTYFGSFLLLYLLADRKFSQLLPR